MATTKDTHGPNVSAGAGVLFGAGAAALGVLSASRPLVGVALYLVAAAASLVLWYGAGPEPPVGGGVAEASPADATLGSLGVASAVVFPALVAADGLGYFTWTGLTTGIALTVAGVYLVFGGFSLLELVCSRER